MRATFFLFCFFFSFASVAQIDFATQAALLNSPLKAKEAPRSKSRAPASKKADATMALPQKEPSLKVQALGLLTGKDEEIVHFQSQLHPEDPRRNRVEIQVETGTTNARSKSVWSPRDYEMNAAEVNLRSNVWLTPGLGMTGAIRFTMGGSLGEDSPGASRSPVREEAFEVGMRVRRFFGDTRLSPALDLGVFYADQVFAVASDSTSYLRSKTSGLGMSAHGTFPSSEQHAWVLGGYFAPRLTHSEGSTGLDARSGKPRENLGLGFELGGVWTFDRRNQLLYGFDYRLERNLFDGATTQPDPVTGETPSNVTATNTRFVFSIGYRWGH